MSSNYADTGDYWTAYASGDLVILAVIAILIAVGVGYALGWRAANGSAQSRRARFRATACACVDKALKEALVARDEMGAVSARRLIETVNDHFRPLLRLSEPLILRLNALDTAVRGKVRVMATPGPTSPVPPGAPSNISPSSGSTATPTGTSVVSPAPIISIAPRAPPPDERPAERDLTVPERDEAVRRALWAFEAFWKDIDAPTAIETTQAALLDDLDAP